MCALVFALSENLNEPVLRCHMKRILRKFLLLFLLSMLGLWIRSVEKKTKWVPRPDYEVYLVGSLPNLRKALLIRDFQPGAVNEQVINDFIKVSIRVC